MSSSIVKHRDVIFFPFAMILLLSAAGLALGWAMEVMAGKMLTTGEGGFYWETYPKSFQSPLAGFFVAILVFQQVILFAKLGWLQKTIILMTGYVCGLIAFLVSSGFIFDHAAFLICLHCELSTIGPWLPLQSFYGWTQLANFVVGSFWATLILSGLFTGHRIELVPNVEESETNSGKGRPIWKPVLAFALFLFIGLYVALIRQTDILGSDPILVNSFVMGVIAGLVIVVLNLAFTSSANGRLGKPVVMVLWLIWFSVFLISVTDIQWRPYTVQWRSVQFAPAILAGSFVYLIFLSIVYSFEAFVRVSSSSKNQKKKAVESNLLDPISDDFADPVEKSESKVVPEEVSDSPIATSIPVPRLGLTSFVVTGLLFGVILTVGFWVPRIANPFVLAVTWDYELAQLVARNRSCAGGMLHTKTYDDGTVHQFRKEVRPLLAFRFIDGTNLFSAEYEMVLNVQPLLSSGSDCRKLFRKLMERKKELKFLRCVYFENGPNGEHFAEIAEDLDQLPLLNAADISQKDFYRLIESSRFVLERYKNCVLADRYFGKYTFSGGPFEFVDCQFEQDFRLPKLLKSPVEFRFVNPKGFSADDWYRLSHHTPSTQTLRRIALSLDHPFIPWLYLLSKRKQDQCLFRKMFEPQDVALTPKDLVKGSEEEIEMEQSLFNEKDFPKERIRLLNQKTDEFEIKKGKLVGIAIKENSEIDFSRLGSFQNLRWYANNRGKKENQFAKSFRMYDELIRSTSNESWDSLEYLYFGSYSFQVMSDFQGLLNERAIGRLRDRFFKKPQLKTAMFEVGRLNQKRLIAVCNTETLVLVAEKSLYLRSLMRVVKDMPRVKQVLILKIPKSTAGNYSQEMANQFYNSIKVKDLKIPVYLLQDPTEKFDFRHSWKDLKEKHQFLLCKPENQ